MIIGDFPIDMSKEELNKICVCNEGTLCDLPLKDYHEVVDRKEFGNKYHESDHFREQCLKNGYRLKAVYPVYHQGWECDQWAASATKDNKNYWITTNHGSLVEEEEVPFNITKFIVNLFKKGCA